MLKYIIKKLGETECTNTTGGAWKWYIDEGLKRDDGYLIGHSVQNIILFGGRLLLAHNRKLYPYHKWFRRVLDEIDDKPDNLNTLIDTMLITPDKESTEAFF